jgi:hypothetical protein
LFHGPGFRGNRHDGGSGRGPRSAIPASQKAADNTHRNGGMDFAGKTGAQIRNELVLWLIKKGVLIPGPHDVIPDGTDAAARCFGPAEARPAGVGDRSGGPSAHSACRFSTLAPHWEHLSTQGSSSLPASLARSGPRHRQRQAIRRYEEIVHLRGSGFHITGVTSSGAPVAARTQPSAVRRHL